MSLSHAKDWLSTSAIVSQIEEPRDGHEDFLTRVWFSYKGNHGEDRTGSLKMRTVELPRDMAQGSTLTIRFRADDAAIVWVDGAYEKVNRGRRVTRLVLWMALGLLVIVAQMVIRAQQ